MNTLRNVGVDEQLTVEQGAYIRQQAVEAARRTFIGRRLFSTSVRKIDAGAQTFGYDTLTHVSDASLDMSWPGRASQDLVNLARSTVSIPTIHKEFEINKLDLASSRMAGTPLNTTTVESAAYKVAYFEDTLLIKGYSPNGTAYTINGLYEAAGNDDASDLNWGTATNIATSINNGINLLMQDNILPPYNLTINPAQYVAARVFIANTAVSYLQWIEESLQGGSIYVTPAISAGNGLLSAANPNGMFEYVLSEDLSTETEVLSIKEGNNLFGRVYIRGLPVVYDANALCKLSDIA